MRIPPVEVNPDEIVEYNGEPVRISDLPPGMATMHGYGHTQLRRPMAQGHPRRVPLHPADLPQTCRRADGTWPGCWLDNGTVLVCTGCGLDCT